MLMAFARTETMWNQAMWQRPLLPCQYKGKNNTVQYLGSIAVCLAESKAANSGNIRKKSINYF